MRTVIAFGTFDLFHVGHVRILERARQLGDRLVVGVSTDVLIAQTKGAAPVFSQQDRMEIVASLRCVDQVFFQESFDLKAAYIRQYGAQILVAGSDWQGAFDYLSPLCRVVYPPRTEHVSTSLLRQRLMESGNRL